MAGSLADYCRGCTERAASFIRTYRDVLGSWEGIATVAGTAILIGSWGAFLAGFGVWERGLAILAAAAAGLPIWWSTARGLWARDFTVDVLVSTAILAALIVGQYQAGAIVAVMLLGGGLLERLTVARASQALVSLLARVPTMATILQEDREVAVSVEEIRTGDVVRVRTGGMVPVDGMVIQGAAAVDQSSITGESIPVEKGPGHRVFAGTLNRAGTLDVRATGVCGGTTLGKIIRLVEEAQHSTAPVQRLANRYAQWYAPLAFAIAIGVYLLTADILRAITVLIVFCPCALVLATPTAVIAGIGNAARRTVLIKGGSQLEAAGRVDVVAFDKTGTLTRGEPAVTDVVAPLSGLDGHRPGRNVEPGTSNGELEVLRLAAAAEKLSEHPLGRAIVAEATARGIDPPDPRDSRIVPGVGVEALVDSHRIFVGRVDGSGGTGILFDPAEALVAESLEAEGKTVLAVAANGQLAGWIALRDAVRPGAVEAISSLRQVGVKHILLLTGDNARAAAAVAKEVGVDAFRAGLLPEEKLEVVRDLQRRGLRVAVAGDGVNDAPALAAADIGIAMGVAGTDVAIESADIALMSSDLARIPEILALARRALRTIRQNVLLSVAINLLAVVLAGLGLVTPVLGAIIHEASAMLVVVNAVRIIEWRPTPTR